MKREELIKELKESKVFEYDETEMSFCCHKTKNVVAFTNNGIELIAYDFCLAKANPEVAVMAIFYEDYLPSLKVIKDYFERRR